MPEPMVYCLHNYDPRQNHNKFYAVQVNSLIMPGSGTLTYEVRAYWGRINADQAQASKVYGIYGSFFQANAKAESMVEEKVAKGYVDLMDVRYDGGYCPVDIYAMIDMTRVLDVDGHPMNGPPQSKPDHFKHPKPIKPYPPKKKAAPSRPEINRSRRLIDI